jgi:hypothetical protein
LALTCRRSGVFSGYSGFLHQWNWRPEYNWNIVERGVKHHRPNRHNKAFLVSDSCRATVINCNNISADFTKDTIENYYNDVCFSYFGTCSWLQDIASLLKIIPQTQFSNRHWVWGMILIRLRHCRINTIYLNCRYTNVYIINLHSLRNTPKKDTCF